MKMEWSNEKTLEFIESYRYYPCLWRSEDPNYKNRIIRTDAVKELAEKYEITHKQVLNKIKSLRSYFHKEHAKSTKRKTGSAASETYHTSWFAYSSMLFILDGDTQRSGTETEVLEQATENIDFQDEGNNETEVVEDDGNPTIASQQPASLTKSSVSSKRERPSYQVDEAYSFMKDVKEKLTTQDRFSHFGAHIACKLRSLNNPRLQAIAEFQITKLLFDMEMKIFENNETKAPSVSNNPCDRDMHLTGSRPSSIASHYTSGPSNPFTPDLLSPTSENVSNDAPSLNSEAALQEMETATVTQIPSTLMEFLAFSK